MLYLGIHIVLNFYIIAYLISRAQNDAYEKYMIFDAMRLPISHTLFLEPKSTRMQKHDICHTWYLPICYDWYAVYLCFILTWFVILINYHHTIYLWYMHNGYTIYICCILEKWWFLTRDTFDIGVPGMRYTL